MGVGIAIEQFAVFLPVPKRQTPVVFDIAARAQPCVLPKMRAQFVLFYDDAAAWVFDRFVKDIRQWQALKPTVGREERKLSAKERLKDILNKPRLVTTAKSNPPTLYFCRQ